MRVVLLLLLALVVAVFGAPDRGLALGSDCCPCAEQHDDSEVDCCLPGPDACACAVGHLVAEPALPVVLSRPAPMVEAGWPARLPDELAALPRPPPPTPPPIG